MNKALFDQMMQRLGSSPMLPPPGDYAPGGAMFPGQSKPAPVDPNAPTPPAPTTMLGKIGQAIAPNTQAAMAGKGGAG